MVFPVHFSRIRVLFERAEKRNFYGELRKFPRFGRKGSSGSDSFRSSGGKLKLFGGDGPDRDSMDIGLHQLAQRIKNGFVSL
jgi:hypothetical protein